MSAKAIYAIVWLSLLVAAIFMYVVLATVALQAGVPELWVRSFLITVLAWIWANRMLVAVKDLFMECK